MSDAGSDEGNVDVRANEPAARTCDGEFRMEVVRRSDLLAELASGPADARALTESLGLSRSTVHRATNSLVEDGLVDKTNGRFSLTGYGRTVAAETRSFTTRICAAKRLAPFLNVAEPDEFPVQHFEEAEATYPKPRQPHFPVREIIGFMEDAEELRILSSVISPFYIDVAYRELVDGTEIEVVLDEETVDIVLEEYETDVREVVDTGRLTVYRHQNAPFEMYIDDDRVGLAAHDDDGVAQIFVESTSDAAIDWAVDRYEGFLEDARRVPLPGE